MRLHVCMCVWRPTWAVYLWRGCERWVNWRRGLQPGACLPGGPARDCAGSSEHTRKKTFTQPSPPPLPSLHISDTIIPCPLTSSLYILPPLSSSSLNSLPSTHTSFLSSYTFAFPYLKSCEPHEPVETVVIGRDDTWPSVHTPRLTLELNFLPLCQLPPLSRHAVEGALKHNLRPFFSHTAKKNTVLSALLSSSLQVHKDMCCDNSSK